MVEQNKIDLFQEIRSKKGFDLIILTTFTFDPSFFDNYLEKVIRRNNPNATIVVLIDLRESVFSAKNFTMETNRDYQLIPVQTGGFFHPKIFLFYNTKKPIDSEMIIGSSNLTVPGITKNLEVISTIKNSPDCIAATLNLFKGLVNKGFIINKNFKEIMDSINLKEISPSFSPMILFNLQENISSQLFQQIKGSVREVTIAAPFYSPNNNLLRLFQEKLKPKKIRVAVQKGNNTLVKRSISNISDLELLSINLEEPRRLHSKIIFIKTDTTKYLLAGSANFTDSALTKTVSEGNCEASLLLSGKNYDEFIELLQLKVMNKNEIAEKEIEESSDHTLPKIFILDAYVDRLEERLCIYVNKRFKRTKVVVYVNDVEERFHSFVEDNLITVDVGCKKVDTVYVEIGGVKTNKHRLYLPTTHKEGIYAQKLKESPQDVFKALLNKGDFSEIISFLSDLEGVELKSVKSEPTEKERKEEKIGIGKKPTIKEELSFIEYLISLVPPKPQGIVHAPLRKDHTPQDLIKKKRFIRDNLDIFINKLNDRLVYIFKKSNYTNKDEALICFQCTFVTAVIRILCRLDLDGSVPYLYQLLDLIKRNLSGINPQNFKDGDLFEKFLSLVVLMEFMILKKDKGLVSKGVITLAADLGEIDFSVAGIKKISLEVKDMASKFGINLELTTLEDFVIDRLVGTFFSNSHNKERVISKLISNFDKSDCDALHAEKILSEIIPRSFYCYLKLIKHSIESIGKKSDLSKFQVNTLKEIKSLIKKEES